MLDRSTRGASHGNLWLAFVVLATVSLVAHYSHARDFGIYEDDYYFTVPPLSFDFEYLTKKWVHIITTLPQGRPLWGLLNQTLTWLLGKLPSLTWAYGVIWLMSTVTAVFVYRFLGRFVPRMAAFAGAIFFVLFPPDTAKIMLMHYVAFPFTTILLIVALTLFLNGRTWAAYAMSAVILLTFEPHFLPFLAAPLLFYPTTSRKLLSALALHVGICLGIFTVVMVARSLLAEERISEVLAQPWVVVFRALTAPFIGVATTLFAMGERVWTVIVNLDLREFVLLMAVSLALAGGLSWIGRRSEGEENGNTNRWDEWFFLVGLVLAAGAYGYRFIDDYYPPTTTSGRLSALHQPSALGFALAFSCVVDVVDRSLIKRLAWRPLVPCLLGLYFGFLITYFDRIQRNDYVATWAFMRGYWNDLIGQIGDLDGDEALIVDLQGASDLVGGSVTMAGYRLGQMATPGRALSDFVATPNQWAALRQMRGLFPDSDMESANNGVLIKTPSWWEPDWFVLEDQNFILFRYEAGRWVRSMTSIELVGKRLTPRATQDSYRDPLEKTRVYDFIFRTNLSPSRSEMQERTRRKELKQEENRSKRQEQIKRMLEADQTELRARPAR